MRVDRRKEMRNEKYDVADLRGCDWGTWGCAVGLRSTGAAEDRNLAVAAARHFLHADPHHREAEADREARRSAWRARRVHQMDHLLRRRRADRRAVGRRRRYPEH